MDCVTKISNYLLARPRRRRQRLPVQLWGQLQRPCRVLGAATDSWSLQRWCSAAMTRCGRARLAAGATEIVSTPRLVGIRALCRWSQPAGGSSFSEPYGRYCWVTVTSASRGRSRTHGEVEQLPSGSASSEGLRRHRSGVEEEALPGRHLRNLPNVQARTGQAAPRLTVLRKVVTRSHHDQRHRPPSRRMPARCRATETGSAFVQWTHRSDRCRIDGRSPRAFRLVKGEFALVGATIDGPRNA